MDKAVKCKNLSVFFRRFSTIVIFIRHKLTCICKSSCRRQFINQIQIRSWLHVSSRAEFIKKGFQGSDCAIIVQPEYLHYQQAFGTIGNDAGIGFEQCMQCLSRIGFLALRHCCGRNHACLGTELRTWSIAELNDASD